MPDLSFFQPRMTTQEIKDHLLQILKEDISLAQSRLSLEEFLASFKSNQDSNLRSSIYEFLLSLLSSRVAAFEKQVADIRESLADIYEYDERWSDAARYSQLIQRFTGHKSRFRSSNYPRCL